MAATSELVKNSLKLSYLVGEKKTKTQSFKNIAESATDDQLVELSDGIEKLLAHSVETVRKEQIFKISKGI
ncbi:DUF1659 domain-containing protein [Clostridium chauvoei]|uniref:DUF1659 domain-containing protein n=2 Tax=Clostridium chauvoei TaxID=46867 RepID=A0A1U6IYQ5_9CLOT|nr:DUF1659 domain-containing protein [Clostridium chauvoei]ATD54245.1 hypothetical protein BTM20_02935 [Clostridium chauvoei]ATD58075.1 hypothetical protein BTM21_10145 [Clostridium chauvoei]MBX7279851.1 DUF1659 domain-containing protein [Clostridium chauvoei]MBX7282231.1 DUF1659 domain-containing protein [Clostridium chauvoei]MBX7284741.1 DUF1659 domain-containing protein [Clostridium chauvoei]